MREKKYLCHQKFSNNSLTKQNIMKKFTQFAMTLALMLMGVVGVYAQEEGEKVYATFENPTGITWDAENMTFSWSSQWGNQLHNIGLPSGNLTEYAKLVIDCEIQEGDGYRFMFYATNKGTTAGGTTIITESGKKEYNLADFDMDPDYLTSCSEICLSGYNASGKVKVNEVYLVKSTDPLAQPKKLLSEALAIAKVQNALGKTEESFAALQNAIAAAENELANEETTADALTDAKTALDEAVAGLQLVDGYTALTTADYMQWDGEAPAVSEAGAMNLNKVLGYNAVVYGMVWGNVYWHNYADLSDAEKLYINGTPGALARCLFNREQGDGEGGTFVEKIIELDANGVGEIDLSEVGEFAHLNCIKTRTDGMIIADLLLYKEPAAPVTVEVTFDFNAMTDHAVSNTTTDGDIPTEGEVLEQENVTLTLGWGSNSNGEVFNRWWKDNKAGNQVRMYSGSLELVAAEGFAITNVVFNNGKWNKNNTINGQTNTTAIWEGNSTNVALEVAGTIYLNSVVVTLAAANEETTTYTWVGTGIQTVKAAQMENVYFDLAGRRVAQPAKGLYIVNGKKVVK